MKSDNTKLEMNINGDLEEIPDHKNTDIATFHETLDMHSQELRERERRKSAFEQKDEDVPKEATLAKK